MYKVRLYKKTGLFAVYTLDPHHGHVYRAERFTTEAEAWQWAADNIPKVPTRIDSIAYAMARAQGLSDDLSWEIADSAVKAASRGALTKVSLQDLVSSMVKTLKAERGIE